MARADSPAASIPEPRGAFASALAMLWRDKLACAASVFLLAMAFCAVFGPALLGDVGTGMNLKMRNAPPGSIEQGWMYVLGADALGRPILPRIIVAAQNTIGVATAAVVVAMVAGGVLGLVAGYSGGWLGTLIMRFADIIRSGPPCPLHLFISLEDRDAGEWKHISHPGSPFALAAQDNVLYAAWVRSRPMQPLRPTRSIRIRRSRV